MTGNSNRDNRDTKPVAVPLDRPGVSVQLRRRLVEPRPPMTEWERNRLHEGVTYRGA